METRDLQFALKKIFGFSTRVPGAFPFASTSSGAYLVELGVHFSQKPVFACPLSRSTAGLKRADGSFERSSARNVSIIDT
jgi:hypothetical protein